MQHSKYDLIPMKMSDRGFGPSFQAEILGFEGSDNSPWLVPVKSNYSFDNIDAMRIQHQVWYRECSRHDDLHRKGLYISGPTGSGKTSFIEQFFARLNVPLVRTNWNPKRESEEMVSSQTLLGGDLMPKDQAIALAAREGIPVLINEIDLADPGELMGLADIVETGLITRPDGTSFTAERGFVVFATGNTAGSEDDTGIYHGTRSQNAAFLRRFFHLTMGYPSEVQEREFLEFSFPGVQPALLANAASVVTRIRQAFAGNGVKERLSSPISRPEAYDWVDMLTRFAPLANKNVNVAQFTMDMCFSARLSDADRTTVHQILDACFS